MSNSSLLELRKFVAPEFVMGKGALSLAGHYAKNFGSRKALIVTDEGVISAGWPEKVAGYLGEEGVPYSFFSRVTPNPKEGEVMEGAEFYRREGCDIIVAVGGGSPIDCAKGIGIASANRKNILEFVGVDMIPVPGPPLICIPTTSSAADVSQFAIITDESARLKTSIVSKTLVPDTSLLDPETTATMPPGMTASSGFDAFVQGIEAYVSNASSPVTDLLARDAIKLVYQHLAFATNAPKNMGHRAGMMLGSLEAGLAFSNASLGLVHAMAHSLGGFTDAPHGLCNSILLPYVVRFNYDAVPERYETIGTIMGLDLKGLDHDKKKAAIVGAIMRFSEEIVAEEMPGRLEIGKKDIPGLARKTMDDVCLVTNPRPVRLEDVIAIFEEALR